MEQKYYAFISYNSKDTVWGKRVQRKLEHYRMPASLCREKGWKRNPIRPVFFAPSDIQPGVLDDELKQRLEASRNLVVICSPNSAKSKWVGEEIAYFHSLGKVKNIHFFIVDGVPGSGDPATECFNPIVGKLKIPEILGANVHEKVFRFPWMNRERAYVQLVSKLLGVEFDSIWQRHKRILRQKLFAAVAGLVAVLLAVLGVWAVSQPFDVEVKLNEASVVNENLPPLKDAVVRLMLDNEFKEDTLAMLDETVFFANIPHKFYGKPVKVSVKCHDFIHLDTTVFLSRKVSLDIYRDSQVYGNISLILWNENLDQLVQGVTITLDDMTAISDMEGKVSFFVPLEKQRPKYTVSSCVPLLNDTIYMPCTGWSVLLVK